MRDFMSNLIIATTVALILYLLFFGLVSGQQETCPDGNGWTKIDSGDLTLYPVDGVTEYCFKYGSVDSQGCEGGISPVWPPVTDGKYCDLSHWSYFTRTDPTATPSGTLTPTSRPTATPSATLTPTSIPSGTPTPTLIPTSTPTPGPTDTPVSDEVWEEIREIEGEVYGPQK